MSHISKTLWYDELLISGFTLWSSF